MNIYIYVYILCIDILCAHVFMNNLHCYTRYYPHSFLLFHCWEQPGSLSTHSFSPGRPQSSQTAPKAVLKRILSSSGVEKSEGFEPKLEMY